MRDRAKKVRRKVMAKDQTEITHAYWLGPGLGCAFLHQDWTKKVLPPIVPASDDLRIRDLRPAPQNFIGRFCGYYQRDDGAVVFCQEAERHPQIDFERTPIRVAGSFNDWGRDGSEKQWLLEPRETDEGRILWERAVPPERLGEDNAQFRFVSSDWHWLRPLACAPNLVNDEAGITNYHFDPNRSQDHAFFFGVEHGRGLDGKHFLTCEQPGGHPKVLIIPGLSFYDLATDLPLGARIESKETVFRVFAPRARKVWVELVDAADSKTGKRHAMRLADDQLTWEKRLPGKLHGAYYYLAVEGENDGLTTGFDEKRRLLDPWALVAAGPYGPGIVIDTDRLPHREELPVFQPPTYQDLVILEAHVRDLTTHAPIALPDDERDGFRGLKKWIEAENSYVRHLGINALELQPIHQYDSATREEYHWGYMTTNFFSPCCHYAKHPEKGSQVEELRDLVSTCHREGLAVIIDVVYNHVGEPPFPLFIDKQYYFHVEDDGSLTNWSGTGNTVRAESAMARRLMIESLVHLVETYNVDGFRFDLAELLTLETLTEIQNALKEIKPSIILIAEPWSFRGNIAWELRNTSFSFWNDQFREFIPAYLRGEGDAGGLAYYMKGCLDHLSAWPSQSINYVESHDDRCWLDKITENPEYNGVDPTPDDIHRTHIMAAILMCSIGIPMLSAGQDFLRSKGGRNNTYLEGEINALDYSRLERFGMSHFYFKQWIAFRNSKWGELLRLSDRPGDDYVRLFSVDDVSAAAVVFNADHSRGTRRILFAVNPHPDPVSLPMNDFDAAQWLEIADRHNFNFHGVFNGRLNEQEGRLDLGPLDCGLWIRE